MKKLMMISVTALGLGFAASSAVATTVEKTVKENCRIGAIADENWTDAHFVSYDDNLDCPRISQRALRRCFGSNYVSIYGISGVNVIERKWPGCDAVQTITYGYNFVPTLLGSVEAIQ